MLGRERTSTWFWRNLIYPIASISTDAVSVCNILTPHMQKIAVIPILYSLNKFIIYIFLV